MSAPPSLRVAVVVFRPDPAQVRRLTESLDRALLRAKEIGAVGDVLVRFGDCTPGGGDLSLREGEAHEQRRARLDKYLGSAAPVRVSSFAENLWHSGGVNRLLADLSEDVAVLLNPDLVVLPDTIELLVRAVTDDDRVAIADARQLPFEHPKPFDPTTGDTPWASMAACAIRRDAWQQVGPLDAEWFPMHGNDVDFSWRARLAGWRVRHVPAARVFHDKRLTASGAVAPSEVEAEFGARAALLLAVKYSRPDVAERHFATLEAGTPAQRRGAEAVRTLLAHTTLPPLLDGDHRVAEFVGGDFAAHRF